MSIKLFCVPGRHVGPVTDEDKNDSATRHGWREVPARFVSGRWQYDVTSGCRVCCCPEHHLDGEPGGAG